MPSDPRSARRPCIRDAPSFALRRTREERLSRRCDHTIETTQRLREMIAVDWSRITSGELDRPNESSKSLVVVIGIQQLGFKASVLTLCQCKTRRRSISLVVGASKVMMILYWWRFVSAAAVPEGHPHRSPVAICIPSTVPLTGPN